MLCSNYVRRLWTHIFGWFSLYSGLRVFLCIFRISVFDSPVRRVRVAMAPNIPIQMELNLHNLYRISSSVTALNTQTCEPNSLVVLMNIVHRTTFSAIKFIRESMSFKVSLNLKNFLRRLSKHLQSYQKTSETLRAFREHSRHFKNKALR